MKKKGAPDTGTSHVCQCGTQRRAWDYKAAAATKKPVCKHRSLSTPNLSPLPGSRDPGTTSPGECTARHRLVHCHTHPGCGRLTPHQYPSVPPACMSHTPWISWFLNPVSSEPRTEALRRPTHRRRSKPKAESRGLCEQRREREISLSSHRSSGLNLHNQLDVPCICGIPE